MKIGKCRLCGWQGELSFEHIPPKTTFNKNTRYTSAKFEDYIKLKNPLNEIPKGKSKQGGIGENSFCEKCNNFLGHAYVPAYKRWVLGGREILKDTEFCFHNYIIHEIEPNKIIKQIISMFLAINQEWFSKEHFELSEFVQNKSSILLSEKYKIFFYLTRAENIRYSPFIVQGNLNNGKSIKCCEISFPPYGYVLTIDYNEEIEKLTNITRFKLYKDKIDFNFKTFQLPTYLSLPLDYRTKYEIEKDLGNI